MSKNTPKTKLHNSLQNANKVYRINNIYLTKIYITGVDS